MHNIMNYTGNGLVIIGTLILITSLFPIWKLFQQIPQKSLHSQWRILTVLIFFFIFGYVFYANLNWNGYDKFFNLLVSLILFYGAIFVFMICLLSLDTTKYIIKAYNLKQENITDPLMGIFNRRYLDRRLNEEVLRCQRYSMPFSVLLIDIDFFKKINDSYGHQIGDLVLIRLAQLIVNSVRESDIVARYGGEEILILLPFTNDSKAFALAERLRKSIEKYEIELSDEKSQKQLSINITVSIGVAVFSKKTFDSHGLIEAADKALYRAKHSGRNMVVLSNDV